MWDYAIILYVRVNEKDQNNPDEPSTYFQYLDTNNIYGWVMIQRLLLGFVWETVNYLILEKKHELVKKERYGYNLEVDVDYPKELYKKHKKLLFSPERE